ncbi:MAG TPA: guanylate kinase [Lachnospiraceae bacterium]|nr:guanylate kinase [Lachnospiraceae bacterium]
MKHKGILLVISGFSGAGKGTLMKRLLQEFDQYSLSTSMTTRNPRIGEVNGKEYFFVTKEEFQKKILEDGFIEYASYCDNYYGTPKDYVEQQLEQGKDVILEIEIQGARKIKEIIPSALLLFVMPPSADELKKRLTIRGTETEDVINNRLSIAYEESKGIEDYDYIVINDNLDQCIQDLQKIVLAAHNTPFRNEEFIEKIREELKGFSKGEK